MEEEAQPTGQPRRRRRKRKYSGYLAEPMAYMQRITPVGANPDKPPAGLSPRYRAAWPLAIRGALKQDALNETVRFLESLLRIVELQRHYGIEPFRLYWSMDLCQELMNAHESDLAPWLSDVYAEYGIVPYSSDAELKLISAIAFRHVPGYRPKFPEEIPHRLSTTECISLYMAFAAVRRGLKAQGKKTSDSAIARILLDNQQLARLIPKAAADGITNAFEIIGNCDRGTPHAMRERTIAKLYVAKMRTATRDYMTGKHTRFQANVVKEVLPFLRHQSRESE